MSLIMQGIYKAYQPGDIAKFAYDEARKLVASGLATVHTAEEEWELALVDLQQVAPGGIETGLDQFHLRAGADGGGERTMIATPNTLVAAAIPAGNVPASGSATVLDEKAGAPALERATAAPNPTVDRDSHAPDAATLAPGGQASEQEGTLQPRAAEAAAKGDVYAEGTQAAAQNAFSQQEGK